MRAGINLRVVAAADALLVGAADARADDFLVLECAACLTNDTLARGMAILPRTRLPVHLIHPNGDMVEALRGVARGELLWLPPRDIGLPLLDALRLRVARHAAASRAPRVEAGATAPLPATPLTRTERKVFALLVEEGLSTRQIAERLAIGRETARTHIAHVLAKFEVGSRRELCALHGKGEGG